VATLLIADDDAHVRRLVHATLRGGGHDVLEAADGDAALAALRAHRPAVAVLDVQMPGRSGLDVCRSVRADPELRDIGVVIVSANAAADDAARAGADAFVPKPFSPLRLLAAVDELAGLATPAAGGLRR
jgi:CheY-like chemotaxis protein